VDTQRDAYFPHIRFYDYCGRLLEFEFSAGEIDLALEWAANVEGFGEMLDKILANGLSTADPETMWSKTAESVSEREQSVARAAVRFAKWNSNSIRRAGDSEGL
jgi:hypothetical protein